MGALPAKNDSMGAMIGTPLNATVSSHASPLGVLRLYVTDTGLCRLDLPGDEASAPGSGLTVREAVDDEHAPFHAQLAEYFGGRRRVFDLPLDLRGTPFQRLVWEVMRAIPWGETLTYGEIARLIGAPGAARAVGLACGANPVPIVVPCHRVVAAGGLGGYSSGADVKRFLLRLEGTAV